jgi:antitoxin VapB
MIYTIIEHTMDTAKIFTSGRSQAVRLPKEYRFDEDEVFIRRLGSYVVLIPKSDPWSDAIAATDLFTEDFMAGRSQAAEPDHRDNL